MRELCSFDKENCCPDAWTPVLCSFKYLFKPAWLSSAFLHEGFWRWWKEVSSNKTSCLGVITWEHLANGTLCPDGSTSHHISPSLSCLSSCLFLNLSKYVDECMSYPQPVQRLSGLLISRALNLACSHVLYFLREKINRDGWRKAAACVICFLSVVCSTTGWCGVSCRNGRNWDYSRDNLQPVWVKVVPVKRSIGNICVDPLPSFACHIHGGLPLPASSLWSVLVTAVAFTPLFWQSPTCSEPLHTCSYDHHFRPPPCSPMWCPASDLGAMSVF